MRPGKNFRNTTRTFSEMGSNQSVLKNKGYTIVSEQDNKILVKNEGGDQFVIKKLRAEQDHVLNFLKQLSHPHIVHHKEVIKDCDSLHLVMELCEGGDLVQKIEGKVQFSETESIYFTACGTIRLGEFGKINQWSTDAQTAKTKSVSYTAPEKLGGKLDDEKSEIWSLGCIIYEMCMLERAFNGRNTFDIHNCYYEALPFTFSEDLRQLVDDMIKKDPAWRPSVSEILIRPFIIKHLHQMSTQTIEELYGRLEVLDELANNLEKVHYNTTVGSLAGGVVGLAGGITSIVGLILTPFTLGASLIVTGVGIGVAVAGGVASGASNITKMVNQRSNRQNIKLLITEIKEKIASTSCCIQNIHIAVETQRLLSENSEAQVASIGRTAAQTARVMRVAEAASGILAGLFAAVDIFFIVLDSREIHRLRQDYASANNKEQELQSEIMKFVKKIRETREELKESLDELQVQLQTLEPDIPNE
ncbi:hypothetical protein Q8A67_001652 [Cirrhinus molitorella]|uniref:Protein kinase domain-containing protein n=1 Tax=Cirrhinus molitorella TaxID=172907 RepID=A0AA88TW19_9TELE|nr:hypothetical protein Q8A67_001652 [Cirrhinus molitorella]